MSGLRLPNDEQKLAVEHHGGVLLAAGAGSGKTFVLVEHIIFLINDFLEKNNHLTDEELEKEIKLYLSKIVLMTFTNKAAGELSVRLKKRFQDEIDLKENLHPRFHMTREALESMTVGTIHGFCFKLLNQGFFPNIAKGVQVINEVEANHRVEQLVRSWFHEFDQDEKVDKKVKDIFYRHYNEVVSSIAGIFASPDLRLQWLNLNIDDVLNISLKEIFHDLIHDSGLEGYLESHMDVSQYNKHQSKKWFSYIEMFEREKQGLDLNNIEDFKKLNELLIQGKGMRGPTSKDPIFEVTEYLEKNKILRTIVSDNIENFEMYFLHQEDICRKQIQCFQSAFDYVESRYFDIPGLTFSDLEYLVLRGVGQESIVDRIAESYQYFIIDEFQDTSEIQFDIISKLVKNDFDKIFCVGDMKQAIYGFRGGELGVFKSCSELVSKNLSMKNNYRSSKNVIDFNNELFKNIFPKSYKFHGLEKESVPVDPQKFPDVSNKGEGALYKISKDVLDQDAPLSSTKSTQIDYAEALGIFEQVNTLRDKFPDQNICILYKKLAPSNYLIKKMMEANVGFTAQMKIPAKEDYVLSIFSTMINLLVKKIEDSEANTQNYVQIIRGHLTCLNNPLPEAIIENLVNDFNQKVSFWGVYESFKKFFYDLGFSNSNFENNLLLIEKIVAMGHGDPLIIQNFVELNESNMYSIDFRFGEESNKVIIMTAHASKGLEFDHVILGGIHTNAKKRPDNSFLGKMPGSFKWKLTSAQKKPYTSPQFIHEKSIEKKKEFQESKRLFYVACTRAVQSLSWMDLKGSKNELSANSESWISGIRSFEDDFVKAATSVYEAIKKDGAHGDLEWTYTEDEIGSINNNPPLFHLDALGNYPKLKAEDNNENHRLQLGLLSELSVTRLSQLAVCPRKFYLSNILKLDGTELNDVKERESSKTPVHDNDVEFKESEEEFLNEELSSSEDRGVYRPSESSANRGTMIHEAIQYATEKNFTPPRGIESSKDRAAIQFAIDLLSEYKDQNPQTNFISEAPLKFPFFNFMISGTPDLLLVGPDKLEVWDYKTGKNKGDDPSYKLQLMCYAYACIQLGLCHSEVPIDLKLVYVDQKDMVNFTYNYSQLKKELYQLWEKVVQIDQVNLDHCEQCQFGNLCPSL